MLVESSEAFVLGLAHKRDSVCGVLRHSRADPTHGEPLGDAAEQQNWIDIFDDLDGVDQIEPGGGKLRIENVAANHLGDSAESVESFAGNFEVLTAHVHADTLLSHPEIDDFKVL